MCDETLYLPLENGAVASFLAGCKTLEYIVSAEEPRVNCKQQEDGIHNSTHTHPFALTVVCNDAVYDSLTLELH